MRARRLGPWLGLAAALCLLGSAGAGHERRGSATFGAWALRQTPPVPLPPLI